MSKWAVTVTLLLLCAAGAWAQSLGPCAWCGAPATEYCVARPYGWQPGPVCAAHHAATCPVLPPYQLRAQCWYFLGLDANGYPAIPRLTCGRELVWHRCLGWLCPEHWEIGYFRTGTAPGGWPAHP